jgi:hypothetical protein
LTTMDNLPLKYMVQNIYLIVVLLVIAWYFGR